MIALESLASSLLDILNPESCLLCDEHVLSESKNFPVCMFCEKHIQLAPVKELFEKKTLYSLGLYEGFLEEGMRRFKLGKVKMMGKYWAKKLKEAWMGTGLFDDIDLIVPTPISHKRLYERGFNQSLVVASDLSSLVRVPCSNILIKHRHCEPQMSLKKSERLTNVRGAYRVKKKSDVCHKKILLFDDVLTTGATMKECMRTIKRYDKTCSIKCMTIARA